MVYGYTFTGVSTKESDSLESQLSELTKAGAGEICSDSFENTGISRPQLNILLDKVTQSDTIVVTSLDKIADSVKDALKLIDKLNSKGADINILNIGTVNNYPQGRFIKEIIQAISESEHHMRLTRTAEGKRYARKNSAYHEGRPQKFTEDEKKNALNLLKNHSYNEVASMTGISRTTLQRIKEAH